MTVHVPPPEDDIGTHWLGVIVAAANALTTAGFIEVVDVEDPPEPSWRVAARAYHRDRAGRCLIVETDAKRLAWLRGLMAGDIAIDRLWSELQRGRA